MSGTTFNVGGTVQIEASISDGRVKATPGQSLKIDVEGFMYNIGGVRGTYSGAVAQSVTDDDTSYVYLDGDAALQINTTGYPTSGGFIALARVTASSGEVVNIVQEKVLLSSSSAVIGTCNIGLPIDGGIIGDGASQNSNNGIPSITFPNSAEPRNRWTFRPPQNYTSGDLTFRCYASVSGSPGSNGVRVGVSWQGLKNEQALPSSSNRSDYEDNAEITKSLSGVSSDEIFYFDITIPAADFDKTDAFIAFWFYRNSGHAEDNTSLTLHTHYCEIRYTGYQVAGQAGQ